MAATGLEVTLHQGRERAEVKRFTHTLNEIVASLREIDVVYIERATRATWVLASVLHRRGNLVIRLEARRVPARRDMADMLVPVQALVDGAKVLQHEPTVPHLFTPATVKRLADLAEPVDGLQTVGLATYNGRRGRRVDLTEKVQKNASSAVQPHEISWGSITGKVIALRDNTRTPGVRLTIRDEARREAVEGEVPETLAEQIRTAWRHRVTIGGKIRRNARGQAIRIDVDRIESMPEDNSGRPSTDSLLGAAEGEFIKLSVDEYVDRLRND
jgi:hypothetical protein